MLVIRREMRHILKLIIDVRLCLILTYRAVIKTRNQPTATFPTNTGFIVASILALSVVVAFVLILHLT
jgi:hypothetical protein